MPEHAPADPAGLRNMKRGATGLLVVAAVVFGLTFALPDTTAVGFVRAAAEAGMIGGVADWFAVTALFRHPLGLPVPHTALIPRQKDALATKLGEFVTGNFLTPDAVVEQLAEARLVRRLATAVGDPETAARVGEELARGLAALLGTVDGRALTDGALDLARRDLDRRSYTPVLGQFLARAVEGRTQRPLVDVCVTQTRAFVVANRTALHPQLKAFLESRGLLAGLWATDRRVDGLLGGALTLLDELAGDPGHPLRLALDDLLARLADDLRYNASTAREVDAQLRVLVEDPQLQLLAHTVLQDVLTSVRTSLDEAGMQHRVSELVGDLARRVLEDPALQARLESLLQSGARYAVEQYGGTVVSLIQRTVAGWDGRDASARIEAAVGRDLQFIRINGTVVGALAGVAIHAVGVLLG